MEQGQLHWSRCSFKPSAVPGRSRRAPPQSCRGPIPPLLALSETCPRAELRDSLCGSCLPTALPSHAEGSVAAASGAGSSACSSVRKVTASIRSPFAAWHMTGGKTLSAGVTSLTPARPVQSIPREPELAQILGEIQSSPFHRMTVVTNLQSRLKESRILNACDLFQLVHQHLAVL